MLDYHLLPLNIFKKKIDELTAMASQVSIVEYYEPEASEFDTDQDAESKTTSADSELSTFQESEEKMDVVKRGNDDLNDLEMMDTLDVINLIQTNPELRILINEFLRRKQAMKMRIGNETTTNDTDSDSSNIQSSISNDSYFSHLGTESQDTEIKR